MHRTQATIEMLEKATYGQPRHPLRLALGNNFTPLSKVCKEVGLGDKYPKVQEGLEHFCKLRQFAPPEFLRRMVAQDVQKNMPEGLVVQRLTLRVSTLNGMLTGSDMVKVDLSQLLVSLMGHSTPHTCRERVRKLVEEDCGKGPAVKISSLVALLSIVAQSMPVTTMNENAAKMGVERLETRLKDALEGRIPDCPVTSQCIDVEDASIMKCCTTIVSGEGMEELTRRHTKCPVCKETFGKVEDTSERALPALGEESSSDLKMEESAEEPMSPSIAIARKIEREERGEESSSEEEEDEEIVHKKKKQCLETAEKKFEERIAEISNKQQHMVDGILAALNAQLYLNPSSRILLCFAFEAHQRTVVRQMVYRIKKEVGGGIADVTDIDDIAKDHNKAGLATDRFDNPKQYPQPQIFILNTRSRSSSVQGMDLHVTDLTIVADECDLSVQRQAAGRSLRMRKRPSTMGAEEKFPKKRIIVTTIKFC